MTILTITGMSVSGVGFAQTIPQLNCSILGASTVGVNQPANLLASGGNGTYAWSGDNLNVTNSGGTQFLVSYSSPGTYSVRVTSAGQLATCNVNVVSGNATTGALSCAPTTQNVTLGQTATLSAFGGDGTYTWSSPELNVLNANGSGFSASYASLGTKTLTVRSAGLVTTCAVNVLSGNVVIPPPVTPGFPNTGGGYGQ